MVESLQNIVRKELQRFFGSAVGKRTLVWFVAVVIMLGVLFSYQASSIAVGAVAQGPAKHSGSDLEIKVASLQISGTATEGSTETKDDTIGDGKVVGVSFTLTWSDEANTARHANQPDTFNLEITSPDGTTESKSGANDVGSEGELNVTIVMDPSAEDFDPTLWD